jgi:tetratricopeptide (TPR) repeat protein
MSGVAASAGDPVRPFPGLRPFSYREHDYYFGRTDQIYALYRMLDRSRFVAVVGSSGSGKSSLVFAGLHPLLDRDSAQTGGRQWVWREMSPKDGPIERLIDLLHDLALKYPSGPENDGGVLDFERSRIEHLIRRSSRGLVDVIAEIEGLKDKTLVLVVDQFEELFRYAKPAQRQDRAMEAFRREEAVAFVQLLLAASRDPASNARIILTMRSDFIGDCAAFRGLPEAVSQTQFLVPGLTRDQFEEVIRKPIENCGSSIDSGLVERLLNDISDETDQLPVLQHCMLRLWQQAGKRANASGNSAAVAAPGETVSRDVKLDDFAAVGRISGALSQHADEILGGLPGLEPVAALVFRALSEVDKEGRAIRRQATLSELIAETGGSGEDLRKIIDRFRADDCSFLMPSPFDCPRLASGTSIGVGHEALLRRWKKVCGDPEAAGETDYDRSIGWLGQESRDSRRYQALLYQDELPLSQVKATSDWWTGTPHTEAWAARYGADGDYARVKQILERGQAALAATESRELSTRRWKQGTFALVCVLLVVAVVLGTKFYQTSLALRTSLNETTKAQSAAESAQKRADAKSDAEQKLADNFLNSVLNGLNRGDISSAAALSMADLLGGAINDLSEEQNDVAIEALFAKQLLTVGDIYSVVGDYGSESKEINAANVLAQQLVAADPNNDAWQALLYGSLFRIGDILVAPGAQKDLEQGLATYEKAHDVAQKLADKNPDDGTSLYNLAFINNKIGDTYQEMGDDANAIVWFDKALPFATKVAAMQSPAMEWQACLPSTMTKLGSALVESERFDEGIGEYDQAIAKQEDLLNSGTGNNDIVLSNLLTSHRLKADALVQQGGADKTKFPLAFDEYEKALKIAKQLVEKDQGNTDWLGALSTVYDHYAKGLAASEDAAGAYAQYQNEVGVRQKLVNKDKTNQSWQKDLAATTAKRDAAKADLGKSGSGAANPAKP